MVSLRRRGLAQGPSNPLSLRRTFGTAGEPRLKLYRDHAAWCPYCQKARIYIVSAATTSCSSRWRLNGIPTAHTCRQQVWLQLEEKKIPYVIEKINMRCYGCDILTLTWHTCAAPALGTRRSPCHNRLLPCIAAKIIRRFGWR